MTLTFNSSQVKRTSDMCFELSKGLSLLALTSGFVSYPLFATLNSLRIVVAALLFFYLSLKLLETGGEEK